MDSSLTGLSPEEKEEIRHDFVKMLQKTKEFREVSVMAIKEIFRECELVELVNKQRLNEISPSDEE